ncbi:MAG: recombinase family protein [Clostridiales bacterium]|nr:recombinase family protein [Clostridiales bacterium]
MYENLQFTYGSGTYAIYLRKSRKDLDAEARGEGETLARHLAILKDLSKRMRLNIIRVYAEVVSGESIEARPQMQKLLRDVETGIYDGVLVVEVERLARGDTSDQGRVAKTFKFSNTLIITPAKTYDPNNEFDEEYFEFGLFMSRREYKTIRRRLTAGMDASCREGKYTGNVPPYGYERCKLKKEKGWSLTVVPEQAAIVRMIFEWYGRGLRGEKAGYSKIAQELNRLGIPAPSGGSWTQYSVQNILRNPVYAGYIKTGYRKEVKQLVDGKLIRSRPLNHDCRLYPGKHEAVISQEIWETVSKRFRRRTADSSTRSRPARNPLSGLVYCSCCHHVMQRRPYQSGAPASLICTTKGCPTVSSFLHLVEQRILDALEVWLASCELPDPEKLPNNTERISLLKSGITACRSELEETLAQIERQYDLLERGVYTEEMFFERNARMRKKKDELTARLEALQAELKDETGRDAAIKNLLPALRTIREAYSSIDSPAAQNALLKEVIDHVEYTKTENGRWGCPDSFTLEIFPRVNPRA